MPPRTDGNQHLSCHPGEGGRRLLAKLSSYYKLGLTQPSLPFVDVDVNRDLKVYVDPRALVLDHTDQGRACVSLVQDFFQTVLHLIRSGHDHEAQSLLAQLREPNETRLGMSSGRPAGRALGAASARLVWDALRRSEAVRTGLLEDLEDTILMVEGISYDIVSDITTNIIRQPLITFTQSVCHDFGIATKSVDSGPIWDPNGRTWVSGFVDLPYAAGGKLLLVPKEYVRRKMDYNTDEYYTHFLLSYMQDIHLADPNSRLVEVLKDGRRRVTKTKLREEYGTGKRAIVRLTREHPQILDKYKEAKEREVQPAMTHSALACYTDTEPPDWDALLGNVFAVKPGNAGATDYHHSIQGLLTALFYPALTSPRKEWTIHQGRKRIDLVFTNYDRGGFFFWVANHFGAPYVIVECKNYSKDVANEELDQLSGRFSPHRGRVGLLLSRSFGNKSVFLERCRDTAQDDRGFIIPLDDDDLKALVEGRRGADSTAPKFELLRQRFQDLVA